MNITYTTADSTQYENGGIVKAEPGTLYAIMGYNSGSAQFIQLHDSATAPAEGTAPAIIIKVPADMSFSLSYIPIGRVFANGIYWCNSSTGPTKTIGSADTWINIQFT